MIDPHWPASQRRSGRLRPPALAQSDATLTLPPITVIGASPLLGSGVDRDTVPAETNVLKGDDLTRGGTTTPDPVRALNEQVGGVNLDSASGNPYQPTLLYHGFEASALQGTPQGLAVYVNGVRFNQAFGDTVNFDLLPDIAIDQMNLEGSNPVFGLNALGGALNVQLKNGFTWQGGEVELSGGSFDTLGVDFQYGKRSGDTAVYVAASGMHQDGWRDQQSSGIENFYGDIGWRGNTGEAAFQRAGGQLGAERARHVAGANCSPPTPPRSSPDPTDQQPLRADQPLGQPGGQRHGLDPRRRLLQQFPAAREQRQRTERHAVQRRFRFAVFRFRLQRHAGGATIPAFLGPNPLAYSELDNQTTNTNGYGVSIQATDTQTVFGFDNHLVGGISFDGAQTEFTAASTIGGITPDTRDFIGPGVVIDEPGNNQPVRVAIGDAYYGAFVADTFTVTDRLALTASGRFNAAAIDLNDRDGGGLTGNHAYERFNPAAGVTYKVTPWLTAYAGYAEANRAPTPAELSCASAADSCSLANFFVGDPDLKQVVSHTVEAGLRGGVSAGGGRVNYDLGFYRSNLDDDIVFVNSATLNRAYFANVGQTRRQGIDASLQYKAPRWSAYVAYSYTGATYQSGFVEAAGSNPAAGPGGTITVVPGDRLPGVPAQQAKLGLTWRVTERWTVGAVLIAQSGQYLFGDAANLTPQLPGFVTLNLSTSYRVTPHIQFFASVENVTDAKYDTYGTFSPTSSVYLAQAPDAANPRAYSPAAPVGGFGGVRITF